MTNDGTVGQAFEVRRGSLGETRFVSETLAPPKDGQVLLAVDSFALTANNITYGVAGDMIGYWRFFPAQGGVEEGWGRIPVWGFADVLHSGVEGIAPGERFYGYLPMASHLLVEPQRNATLGFRDQRECRRDLPAVYNQYQRCSTDPAYHQEQEAMQALFRPLFTTSFFLDDFLADNSFFGARNVILSSASSKTSLGLAWLLHRNRQDQCRVIGLTSAGNADFVRSLGCYDDVLLYDELLRLPKELSVFVDMAGNAELRSALHERLAVELRYSCSVGATHWESSRMTGNAPLPGPQPTMFFAPSQIQKRSDEWGAEELAARIAGAWNPFIAQTDAWIAVRRESGMVATERVYRELLNNRASPAEGFILSL